MFDILEIESGGDTMKVLIKGTLKEVLIALQQCISEYSLHCENIAIEDAHRRRLSTEVLWKNSNQMYYLEPGTRIDHHEIAMLEYMGVEQVEVVRPISIGFLHYQSKLIHDIRTIIDDEVGFNCLNILRKGIHEEMLRFNQHVLHGKSDSIETQFLGIRNQCDILITKNLLLSEWGIKEGSEDSIIVYDDVNECIIIGIQNKMDDSIIQFLTTILDFLPLHLKKETLNFELLKNHWIEAATQYPIHIENQVATPLHGSIALQAFLSQPIYMFRQEKAIKIDGNQNFSTIIQK